VFGCVWGPRQRCGELVASGAAPRLCIRIFFQLQHRCARSQAGPHRTWQRVVALRCDDGNVPYTTIALTLAVGTRLVDGTVAAPCEFKDQSPDTIVCFPTTTSA